MKEDNSKKYENKQGICPNCKESNLEYEAIELEGDNMAYFPFRCKNCGLQGEEWYSMRFEGHNIYDKEEDEWIEL